MSQRPPRPRAFRLDDRRIAVDDQPAPYAPEAVIRSTNEPIPAAAAPAPIDEAELKIEAAQKSGLIARSRFSLARLAWTGLGGLVSLALGLWATNLIEGLFAKAELLGIIGLVFGLVFLVGLIGLAAREIIAVARQTRIAEMHVAFAKARAADDRAAARRLVGQLVALYRDRPETAHARAEVEDAMRAIIDGRDLIDVAERALLRPLDEKAQGEIAAAAKRVSLVTAISPRAVLDVIFVVAQIVRLVQADRRNLRRPARPPRPRQARALDRRPYRHHRRHGGRRQPAAAAGRPRDRLAHLGPNGRRRAQRPAHRPRRPLRARRLPPGALLGRQAPGVSEVAPFLFSEGGVDFPGDGSPASIHRLEPLRPDCASTPVWTSNQ